MDQEEVLLCESTLVGFFGGAITRAALGGFFSSWSNEHRTKGIDNRARLYVFIDKNMSEWKGTLFFLHFLPTTCKLLSLIYCENKPLHSILLNIKI